MPDLAQNRLTGLVHDAAELPFFDMFEKDGWKCPDCEIAMIPVAADGAQDYRVAPHFRCNGVHAQSCRYGEGTSHRTVEHDAPPASHAAPQDLFPRTLRLALVRGDSGVTLSPTASTRPTAGNQRGETSHFRPNYQIAGSLHRIVDCYVHYPQLRSEPLRIDGCEGQSYASCFRRLRNVDRAVHLPQHVYFAEISFRRIDLQTDSAEITLEPLLWLKNEKGEQEKAQPGPRYRVRFETGSWTARRRNGFFSELARQRAAQQEMHHSASDERVNVFFLGRQDEDDRMLFLVGDPRLAHFARLPRFKGRTGRRPQDVS